MLLGIIPFILPTVVICRLFSDVCDWFIKTVDFLSLIKLLPSAEPSIPVEVVAFSLRLTGHLVGTVRPLSAGDDHELVVAACELFDRVVITDVLWNQARVRAAWLIGLWNTLAYCDPNNRSWMSTHGK